MSAPTNITYRKKARELVVTFNNKEDGSDTDAITEFALSAEYLRVYSPSAEVRGHGPEERKLVSGKKHVGVTNIEAIGNYAIRITFDDGHDTGLYAWDYLRELHDEHDRYWGEYMKELKMANASRLPTIPLAGGAGVGSWQPE